MNVTVVVLCWSWLELAELLRNVTSRVCIKFDDHTLDVGIICKCVLPAQLYYLQVCAACPTVLFTSVCCLPKCIISKCVLLAELYYLQVCAACPTVLLASVCCLHNCIIYKCVLPAQLYYLQVCAACPTPRLISKDSNPVHLWEQYPRYVPYRDLARYNRITWCQTRG
jgi:hypothetical protein